MKLLQKLKAKRKLNEALKSANEPLWYIEYETQYDEGQATVYASSYNEAVRNADSIIRLNNGNKPYSIKSVSVI